MILLEIFSQFCHQKSINLTQRSPCSKRSPCPSCSWVSWEKEGLEFVQSQQRGDRAAPGKQPCLHHPPMAKVPTQQWQHVPSLSLAFLSHPPSLSAIRKSATAPSGWCISHWNSGHRVIISKAAAPLHVIFHLWSVSPVCITHSASRASDPKQFKVGGYFG